MAYTYRFINKYNETIYIGYTGQQMAQRMNQHFTKGHLPQSVYEEVAKIEYIKHKTKSDAQVWEVYLINKYKPRYNTLNKKNDMLTIDLGEENWKVYQVLKQQATKQKAHWGCLTWVTIAGLIYAIYQFITM